MDFVLDQEVLYEKSAEWSEYEICSADWHDSHGLLIALRKEQHTVLCINGTSFVFPTQSLSSTFVRWIDSNHFVIVDRSNTEGKDNVFIMDLEGTLCHSFYGGEGVQDVEVAENGIWLSYHDEGVTGSGISEEGLVLFGYNGKVLFRYFSDLANKPYIDDCYAMTQGGGSTIWLFPYSEFPLIQLNAATKELQIYKMPQVLHGTRSIGIRENYVYTVGNYKYDGRLYALEIGRKTPQIIGELEGYSKGLGLSKRYDFISFTEGTVRIYTIKQARS
ncbi:TetR family transcriptional regulator [Planococcus sp. N028]|uniref:TetR family transcriptional regulator n=1 Tax=Planococcus shixiaomingii TaxID=3058393 RepID=A0ABT8MZ89_9BACL|nr:TetR family transcriptional regulator [Planococcus sp. N028]MDN7240961.1 TetR family transcriptional regulator [Planococcus sp. N028]